MSREVECTLDCLGCGPVLKLWRVPTGSEGVFTNQITDLTASVTFQTKVEQQHCPHCGGTLTRSH